MQQTDCSNHSAEGVSLLCILAIMFEEGIYGGQEAARHMDEEVHLLLCYGRAVHNWDSKSFHHLSQTVHRLPPSPLTGAPIYEYDLDREIHSNTINSQSVDRLFL